MKILSRSLLYVALILYHTVYTLSCHTYDPLLVAVIMVKDEETVIESTLQPFIDGNVDAFFVFDTGSTDNTISVTQEFFKKNNILLGYIEEEPFIDFATSRNHALERAHKQFPNAGFMIMLDAEWYLNDAHELVKFCELCLNETTMQEDAYFIRILNDALDFYIPRLIRCNRNVQFAGVVHETFYCQATIKVPETIYFKYLPASHGIEKSNNRYTRDRELLYKKYLKNPFDTRTLFYLARACEDIGNLEEAYRLYKKRTALVGWPEEDFMVLYRLAQTTEKLSYENDNYSWSEALGYYLQAYSMRPHRAEPLISIACYYVNRNDMHTAFLFARRSVEIPYPDTDNLFVQRYAYDYFRYELLSRCAWYSNEFEIGQQAAQKAYDAHPEYSHTRNNLACYQQRKLLLS